MTPAVRFGAMAAACFAAVAAALVAQYGFDMQPCPWCILQRLIFLAIGLACVVGALITSRPVQIGFALVTALLALLGATSAVWQQMVAAKSSSCNLTLADKILNSLGVEAFLPSLFQVTANCADATARVLGLPFEVWSLALFALLALGAASAVLQLRERA